MEIGTLRVKTGLAEMLKGGVIMDVTTAEQARIAEDAGAVAVMALERVPADIRAQGGVARMADPDKIQEIQEAVTIPVMAKCAHRPLRRGADPRGARGRLHRRVRGADARRRGAPRRQVEVHRAVRLRLHEPRRGAAPHRRGRGDDPHERRGRHRRHRQRGAHMRSVFGHIRRLQSLRDEELFAEAKELRAPYELVKWVAENGRLPVVTFTAGGIATPADAALCMQLGADGVFVGSGIFKSDEPGRAREGDRRGDDALRGRRGPRARVAGSRRRDERPLHGLARPGRAARDPRLVGRFRARSLMARAVG